MSSAKLWKTNFNKFLKISVIFLVVFAWLYSGFPQIWQNPRIPPKIQKARAATGLVFVGYASSTGNSASFNVSLTGLQGGAASSAAAGDLVIVIDGWNGTADGNPGVGTAGYTELADLFQDDGFDVNMSANWKTMGSSPDTLVSCNGSGSATNGAVCLVHVWRNAASTTPIDVTTVTAGGINGATPDNSAITPVTQGAVIVDAAMATDDDNTLPTVSTPTGFSNLVRNQVDPTNAISAGMVSKTWSGSGSDGTADWGNWDTTNTNSDSAITIAIRPATTRIGNDTNPGINPTIAPEAATTTVDTFNLRTDGYSDTATSTTVTFATGTGTTTSAVLITSSNNATVYCTAYSPTGDAVLLTDCNLPVTSASTTFNVRIKPLAHGSMPAPPGSTYNVMALVTSIGSTYLSGGSDTTSDAVTIDNASPNGATATSGSAGDTKVTINWTTSNSSDFDTTSGSVILRWAAAAAGSEVPAEGKSDYAAGNTISTATVACVISSAASTAQTKIDGSGGDTGCTTAALTNAQQYTYVAFQRDTNGNYDVGVNIGTFTPNPAVSLTFEVSINNFGNLTPGTPGFATSTLSVKTDNSTGWNVILYGNDRDNPAGNTTCDLDADLNTTVVDQTQWVPGSATTTVGNAVYGATLGNVLAFRVMTASGTNSFISKTWWGLSDAYPGAGGEPVLWAGVASSTVWRQIGNSSVSTGGATSTNTVNYYLDVNTASTTGQYSCPLTFTATVNP